MEEINYVMPGKILDTGKEMNFANMRDGYIKQEGSLSIEICIITIHIN